MSFPLYRRPGGVVFLDDDPDYLEMLAEVMPADWFVRLFLQPADCIDELLREPARWESDCWRQQEIITGWREGKPLIPRILQYWREDGTARFALTQVCVVDYSMPAMSGLRVLSEVGDWAGSRILLTGRADEQLAVSAFNRGLIEQFIPKQSPDIRQRVTDAIQHLLKMPSARLQNLWRSTLSREQNSVLCIPSVARDLEQFAASHGWVEHVLIGAPFGALALDRAGQVSWLQLEPKEKLAELSEMAEAQGCPAADVAQVRFGQALVDVELQQALGSRGKPQLREAQPLGSEHSLLAALFPLEPALWPAAENSYDRFVTAQGERQLRS